MHNAIPDVPLDKIGGGRVLSLADGEFVWLELASYGPKIGEWQFLGHLMTIDQSAFRSMLGPVVRLPMGASTTFKSLMDSGLGRSRRLMARGYASSAAISLASLAEDFHVWSQLMQ